MSYRKPYGTLIWKGLRISFRNDLILRALMACDVLLLYLGFRFVDLSDQLWEYQQKNLKNEKQFNDFSIVFLSFVLILTTESPILTNILDGIPSHPGIRRAKVLFVFSIGHMPSSPLPKRLAGGSCAKISLDRLLLRASSMSSALIRSAGGLPVKFSKNVEEFMSFINEFQLFFREFNSNQNLILKRVTNWFIVFQLIFNKSFVSRLVLNSVLIQLKNFMNRFYNR